MPGVSASKRHLRRFGLTVGAAFAVLGAVLVWKGAPAGPYLLAVAGVLGAVGLVAPLWLRPVEWAWMRLAEGLGWIMTRVILTGAFFLLITPMGLLLRLLRKDLLARRLEPDRDSYWTPVEPDGPATRLDTPY